MRAHYPGITEEVVQRLEAVVAELLPSADAPDAQPKRSWIGLPAADHFDDFDDDDLMVGSVVLADMKTAYWHRCVLRWDGESSWTDTKWPSPALGERLCCYLHVLKEGLNTAREQLFEGAVELAQQRLTALLLKHPVLLHPALSVHVSLYGNKGKVPVAHAIATSYRATLPMRRHGASEEQLRHFANHPCVLLGLQSRPRAQRGRLKAAFGRGVLSLALHTYQFRPALFAALHELDRYVVAAQRPLRVAAKPYLATWPEKKRAGAPTDLSPEEVAAHCFQAAVGCHIHNGARPNARFDECNEYLALLEETGAAKDKKFIERFSLELPQMLIPGSLRSNFAAAAANPGCSYEQVVDGCERVLRGMVAIGLGSTPQQAAHALRNLLALNSPPHCHVEHALAVIRALSTHGEEMTPDDFSSSRTRDVWSQALHVHRTEVDMAKVIVNEVSSPTGDSHPMPARRTSRAL